MEAQTTRQSCLSLSLLSLPHPHLQKMLSERVGWWAQWQLLSSRIPSAAFLERTTKIMRNGLCYGSRLLFFFFFFKDIFRICYFLAMIMILLFIQDGSDQRALTRLAFIHFLICQHRFWVEIEYWAVKSFLQNRLALVNNIDLSLFK